MVGMKPREWEGLERVERRKTRREETVVWIWRGGSAGGRGIEEVMIEAVVETEDECQQLGSARGCLGYLQLRSDLMDRRCLDPVWRRACMMG